jgi:hypothetical protein
VNNSMLLRQAAGDPRRLRRSAVTPGIGLPSGVVLPLASAGDVFAELRPWPHGQAPASTAAKQVTRKKYQDMTRIAANGGGVSGSHPAWDPV